jgi:hypothetical protein
MYGPSKIAQVSVLLLLPIEMQRVAGVANS